MYMAIIINYDDERREVGKDNLMLDVYVVKLTSIRVHGVGKRKKKHSPPNTSFK